MCGTLARRAPEPISGVSGRTSPSIQSRPAVSPNSSPRLAISCMPTQIPRNVAPRARTASPMASITPGRARRARLPAAKAPTPGSTTCSARAIVSGSSVATTRAAPPSRSAARRRAFSAEGRLPEP